MKPLLILAMALFASGPANARTLEEVLKQNGYSVVPLRRSSQNHLLFHGHVNGRKVAMMIDTGAPTLSIDPSRAVNLKRVATIDGKQYSAFRAYADQATVVQIDRLTLGGLSFEAEPAKVAPVGKKPQQHISSRIARADESVYDVVLGWEFLSRRHAIIDAHTLKLYLRQTEPPAELANSFGRSLLASGFTLVPLTLRNFMIELSASVNGREALFVLDTGAFVSLLDLNQAASLDVNVRERILVARDLSGAQQPLSFAVLETLRIGDFDLQKMDIGVTDLQMLNQVRGKDGSPLVHGLIGAEILDRGRAIIDCANLRLYLYARRQQATKK